MKKWQVRRDMLNQYIPFSVLKKRLHKQVCALNETALFDKDYYVQQAAKLGIKVDTRRAVWHYVTVGDRLRLKPHRLFDTLYYHDIYRDVEAAGVTALHHFIEHGAREDRNPHPSFDSSYVKSQTSNDVNPLICYVRSERGSVNPHRLFDEKYVLEQLSFEGFEGFEGRTVLEAYFESDLTVEPSEYFSPREYYLRYPDIKDLHPFYHYTRWGISEGRLISGKAHSIENVRDEIEFIGQADPDIIAPWQSIDEIGKVERLKTASLEEQLLLRLAEKISWQKNTYVHITNSLAAGGAEKVLVNVCNSMQTVEDVQQILIVITGHGEHVAHQWLDGDKYVIVNISDIIDPVPLQSATLTMAIFLRLLKLRGIFVVNSHLGWNVVERHGKVLNKICNVSVACFCYDYDVYGRRAGYARTHLPHSIKFVSKIITDNFAFKNVLVSDLRLEEEEARKISVLYQPIDVQTKPAESRERFRREMTKVLWAGRFTAQKRPSLAIEIAKRMPNLRFIFAGGDKTDVGLLIDVLPQNVSLFGKFDGFHSLPTEDYDLFLYTAEWDGLPNVLLEAAAVGLPIVAPDVGGISELISENTGWPVFESSDVQAYVNRIAEVVSNPELAQKKTRHLNRLIETRHTRDAFAQEVVNKLLGNECRG